MRRNQQQISDLRRRIQKAYELAAAAAAEKARTKQRDLRYTGKRRNYEGWR